MPKSTPTTDVIVIGGGAAGLAAARELSRRRLRVVLLEARPRLGGRIDTRRPKGWSQPVELGAEFVHGGNPVLWGIVQAAGIKVRRLEERHWLGRPGSIEPVAGLDRRLSAVTSQIKPAKAGRMSFAGYFARFPYRGPPENWRLARSFVEGFEAAPIEEFSARSLAGEAVDEGHQYGVPGGYDQLIAALARACARGAVRVHQGTVVRDIRWLPGDVRVTARHARSGTEKTYAARALVVALPLGVLQRRRGPGAVRFRPPLAGKQRGIDRMRMGHVVRLVLRFRAKAWKEVWPKMMRAGGRGGFGFVHSTIAGVPVWWSHSSRPILVGWAGGPAARALAKLTLAGRKARALRSLGGLLDLPPARLGRSILGWQAHDWSSDPFARGAYSFTAAGEDETARELRTPVAATLFFAGEATAEGSEVGTVHGALASGLRAAHEAAAALKLRHRD